MNISFAAKLAPKKSAPINATTMVATTVRGTVTALIVIKSAPCAVD
jgi:hypothetical protein